jgi:lysophospholipase L1-like esterase
MVGLLTRVLPSPGFGVPSPDIPYEGNASLLLPNDARIDVTDYASISEQSATRLRFIRPIADSNNFQHCSPGSRARIKTSATSITFKVYFNGLVTRLDARNFIATLLVDGVVAATFTNPNGSSATATVLYTLTLASSPSLRTIELIWPYGDGMDLLSIEVNNGSLFGTPDARPSGILANEGDSITHGFFASKTTETWTYKLAVAKGRRMLNLANGSNTANPSDASALVGTGADRVTYMIGYNNFVAQTALATFQAAVEGWINNAEAALPSAKIYVISPIYSPNTNTITLAQYRSAIVSAVANAGGPNVTYINGLSIMANSNDRLADTIHPNDLGASEIASNLAALVA